MSCLIRLLLPLIGYACVATVISAGLGYGYLRKSGQLDDETLFRITALGAGVDLEEIEKAKQARPPGVAGGRAVVRRAAAAFASGHDALRRQAEAARRSVGRV